MNSELNKILKNQEEMYQKDLLQQLEWLKSDIAEIEDQLKRGYYGFLGGSLQNVWQFYITLGQLKKIEDIRIMNLRD